MTIRFWFANSSFKDDRCVLLWDQPIKQGNPVHRYLADLLESVRGVDDVYVERYSADLKIALHVTSPDEAEANILQLLKEDPELLHLLKTQYGDDSAIEIDEKHF